MIGIVFAAFKTVIRTKIFVYFALSVLMALFFEEVVDDVFSDPFEGDNEAADMDRAIVQWVRGL
ncbi:MAG: hypothetical protein V4692_16660, partial [Bdellovibrionota bacterium]